MGRAKHLTLYRAGKYIKILMPKGNNVPKTKRMRKKYSWYLCDDCKKWFLRYSATHGFRGGKPICNVCLIRIFKNREEQGK